MKKALSLVLVLVLALSLFTACGAKTQTTPSQSEEASSQPADSQTAEADPFAEEVKLVYVLPTLVDSNPGLDAVLEKVNEITKEKINATIELELIPLAEYTDKMNMKFTAGEAFDLCFTGAWNPYLPAVSKGAYAELTEDMLNTYAPDMMAQLNPSIWDALKVDGKIYGTPIQQIYVRQTGIRFATDYTDKYNFDYKSVQTLDDLDDYLATIKENEPALVPFYMVDTSAIVNFSSYMGFDCLVDTKVPGAVYYAAETPEVVNQFASPEFKALCEKVREWNLAGYLPADAVTGGDSVQNQVFAVDSDPAHKPGGDATESMTRGYTVEGVAVGDCAMTTNAVQATITAVSSTSQNVERSVAFINLLNTDAELLNLFCHGIEGVDYGFVGDAADGLIQVREDAQFSGWYSFFIGNVFNDYYTDAAQVGTWDETAEINNNAKPSCILGFAFNSDAVSTQIAQCSAVVSEYLPALCCGAVEVDSTLEAFLKALDDAGVQDILTEMQAQVDAWKA